LNFFGHFPVTTGMNDLMQFGQFSTSGKFRKFDYGRRKNAKVYGQNEPPEYDLGKIKVPAYLLYGKNDIYTSEKVMERSYFDNCGTIVTVTGH
jgi:lysosomal acid lipase/cholesteryl ester hydrolase